MTAKVCVRTHNAGECTRASKAGALLWTRDGCLLRGDGGPAGADETAAVARYKLIFSRLHRASDNDDGPARAFYIYARTHAHPFSRLAISLPLFLFYPSSLSLSLSPTLALPL